MKYSTLPCLAAATLAAFIALAAPAHANSIPVTYNLTGTGTVVGATATSLSLAAKANGSILSGNMGRDAAWNPVSYSDTAVLDFTNNLLNGSFTFILAN